MKLIETLQNSEFRLVKVYTPIHTHICIYIYISYVDALVYTSVCVYYATRSVVSRYVWGI